MSADSIKLQLLVKTFDDSPFANVVRDVEQAGITFQTLAELGDTPENRRLMYEVNRTCSADIPDRGPFHSWDNYVRLRIDVASFDPAGVIVGRDRDEWVGLCATSNHAERGFMFSEMTGVVSSHRRRNIALAMKLLGIRYVREQSVPVIRTIHHPRNQGMIALNRRLGFVDGAWG